MGKLIIDGNKVYTVDEECMKRKNLTLAQIQGKEAEEMHRRKQGQQKWKPGGCK